MINVYHMRSSDYIIAKDLIVFDICPLNFNLIFKSHKILEAVTFPYCLYLKNISSCFYRYLKVANEIILHFTLLKMDLVCV